VTGVSTGSFSASNGSVTGVSTTDNIHYTVTVSPTVGVQSGNVALSLVAGGATDSAGNAVVAANLSGFDSQAIDTKVPTVTAVSDNVSASVTNSAIGFSVTFVEAVTGVSTNSFTATNGSVTSVTSSDGIHYTVNVTPSTGVQSGSVALSLVSGGAIDAAGNAAVTANLSGLDSQAIDTKAPTATITMSDSALTVGETSTVTVTFSEAVTGFDATDITAPNGTLGAFTSTDNVTWTGSFKPNAGTTAANNVLTLAASSYTDAAGNGGGGATSTSYSVNTVANLAPVITAVHGLGIVSSNANGVEGDADSSYWGAQVHYSRDGKSIIFGSNADNLVAGDTNGNLGASDVFIKNLETGAITRVNTDNNGYTMLGSLSADGHWATFTTTSALVGSDTNGNLDVYLKNLDTGAVTLVSPTLDGQAPSNTLASAVSADGRYVYFYSDAANLVAGDTGTGSDIFRWDRDAAPGHQVTLITNDATGQHNQVYTQYNLSISDDGRWIAYTAAVDVPPYGSQPANFVLDTQTGTKIDLHSYSYGGPSIRALPAISRSIGWT
jgi:hypothetical protein